MAHTEKEAEVQFHVPSAGKKCYTWYKVLGNLSQGKTPLIVLHGGPGACHEYLLSLDSLTKRFGIPTIFYDQIGNGKSTRLPEKIGDDKFWTEKLFIDELDNLVQTLSLHERGFDLIGHSWGGMLGSAYACTQPPGLRRVIIANSPADVGDWEKAARHLLKQLPEDVQKVIEEADPTEDAEEFERAMTVYRSRYFCKVKPWPAPEIQLVFDHIQEDPTSFATMKGFSEISIAGNLKTWQVKDRLYNVKAPVLLINGSDDQAQDLVVLPFFQRLEKVKWVTIDNASHNPLLEQKAKVINIISSFLLTEGV